MFLHFVKEFTNFFAKKPDTQQLVDKRLFVQIIHKISYCLNEKIGQNATKNVCFCPLYVKQWLLFVKKLLTLCS